MKKSTLRTLTSAWRVLMQYRLLTGLGLTVAGGIFAAGYGSAKYEAEIQRFLSTPERVDTLAAKTEDIERQILGLQQYVQAGTQELPEDIRFVGPLQH